jgi:threonine synthase
VLVAGGGKCTKAAAYAAAAGIECAVFCHADASPLQMALMGFYGAGVFRGGRREEMLTRLVARGDWFPASTYCPRDGCANPFGIEGFKTIAFEIVADLGGKVPEAVFVPAGSGDGLYGIWKGFRELREAGATSSLPHMFLCQTAAMDPYVRAFRAHSSRVNAVEPAHTAALSIAEPMGGRHALAAVYASGGEAVSATEQHIASAMRFAARRGFAIEPASATAVACALQKRKEAGEIAVVVATGAAVKWPETILSDFVEPARLPADFDSVEELLGEGESLEEPPSDA